MSLAGAQGKFSLAKVGDRWFWPTYEQPSTHIFKPPAKEHKQIEFYENMGLEFAKRLGLAASVSSHVDFLGQPTFMVERWDRFDGIRLHAEDLNQALGSPTREKYDVKAASVIEILGSYGLALMAPVCQGLLHGDWRSSGCFPTG